MRQCFLPNFLPAGEHPMTDTLTQLHEILDSGTSEPELLEAMYKHFQENADLSAEAGYLLHAALHQKIARLMLEAVTVCKEIA
jgi:hypothetical protein